MTELEFMGVLLSGKGIGLTSTKVEAMKNAQRPKLTSEVHSILGLVSFSAWFTDDLATKVEPSPSDMSVRIERWVLQLQS